MVQQTEAPVSGKGLHPAVFLLFPANNGAGAETHGSHKSTSIGDFSQASPSAYAMGAATAFEILERQTEQEMENQEFGAQLVSLQGQMADRLGHSIQAATEKEADYTRGQAYTSIGEAAASLTGELAAPLLPHTVMLRDTRAQLATTKTELGNVKSHEDGIREIEQKNAGKIEERNLEPAALSQNEKDRLTQALKRIDAKKTPFKEGSEEKSKFEADLAAARFHKLEAYDEFKADLKADKKALQKEQSNLESKIEERKRKILDVHQTIARPAVSAYTTLQYSAKAKDAEADARYIQSVSSYADETAKTLGNANTKYSDAIESQKQSTIRALFEGLADSNRV